MKFIHTADLHLGSPIEGLTTIPEKYLQLLHEHTNQLFAQLVKAALREKVDFILIAGDFFDNHAPSVALQVAVHEQFEKLQRAGISVYLCLGNHDYLNLDKEHVFFPENVFLFPNYPMTKHFRVGTAEVALTSFSYAQRWTSGILQQFPRKGPEKWHLGMLHGALKENDPGGHYAPFDIPELLAKRYDYWALGHIHKRMELAADPPIVYPGCLQGKNRKESGSKGFYVVEEQAGKLVPHFCPMETLRWQTVDFTLKKGEDEAKIEQRIFSELVKLSQKNDKIALLLITVRLFLTHGTATSLQEKVSSGFLVRRLRDLLKELPNLCVEKLSAQLISEPAISLIDQEILAQARQKTFQSSQLTAMAGKLLNYPFIEKHLLEKEVQQEIETAAVFDLVEEADDDENITG
ncbi:DNA repair exonuclease [Liquorilactobacillus satsumensis]|uniref:metallophosphoesterase family protein n=1 Tax=Liquorilactobacillus satsumensis TaxID=259059 RepID=UPI0021C3751A|nr:DNA repair exonuclease [Liquorilactobacillus satsumensis]MCP9356511.1 DNA repair exonuclease [Liquorilactobacillus satsumensis]MCP9370350.1 DNA repair exonuclease [Liquorilactobacillus satsumensis]